MWLTLAGVVLFLCCLSCTNQESNTRLNEGGISKLSQDSAQQIFTSYCAGCHMDNGQSRAPGLIHLGSMTPRSIMASLETGKMQVQGEALNRSQKIALAEFLTNRQFVVESPAVNYCSETDLELSELKYSGWGGNNRGTGNIPFEVSQLKAEDVPNLNMKWAFAFDGGNVTRTKPAVIDHFLIFGSQFGEVYCLDMYTGCVKWIFEADANVRGGMAVSENENGAFAVHFADFAANVYSLNASDGSLKWKSSVKTEPNNAVTGTVAYHDGLLYVPLTSMEVVTAGQGNYQCCKGSGQVVAVEATSGREVWRHRVIEEAATERGVNKIGVKIFGPSGSPVWSSPTIDAERGLLYLGTGENNSNPPTNNSDAIQALDLKTGALIWNFQATSKDAYISACPDGANCPDPPGPDVDFGMAPLLTTTAEGKDVLVVGQKSGVVHCLDPGTGKPIWQKRIGRGGALGGIHWGMATDGKLVYATNSDWLEVGNDPEFPSSPGVYALDLLSGEVAWKNTPDPSLCEGIPGCHNANSAAPTLIDGVVFAGGLDGFARAYDANTGEVIWQFDTNQSFETVNGVEGHGGAIDGPGPVVANGMVFFNSGYGLFGQMPGNLLLAFAVE